MASMHGQLVVEAVAPEARKGITKQTGRMQRARQGEEREATQTHNLTVNGQSMQDWPELPFPTQQILEDKSGFA